MGAKKDRSLIKACLPQVQLFFVLVIVLITTPPMSMNVTLGSQVALTCASNLDNVNLFWTVITARPNVEQTTITVEPGAEITATFTATGDPNPTVIRCDAELQDGSMEDSATATITIQGT